MSQKGFTLIEIIIVITVIGIIASIAGPFIIVTVNSFDMLTTQANLQENGMVALSRITRDVRRLKNDLGVLQATADTFRFIDINGNDITYTQSGTTFTRQVQSDPPNILADKVVPGGLFLYRNIDGNAIASPAVFPNKTNIRHIEFQITFLDDAQTLNVKTAIRPRNLLHDSDLFA